MGWRDRIDNSFANKKDNANRVQNVKSDKNNNKKGPKVFFKGPSQYSQYSQKRPKADNISKVKELEQKIPAPEPPGMGPEYDSLWKKAWALADWIDGPDSDVPWQERTARVPELQKMSMMLSELEALIKQQREA